MPGSKLTKAIKELMRKLGNNEPIEATRIVRVQTPDGPMHLRTKVLLPKDKPDAE